MSPTVFRYKSYRFYFFSREETRMHVHVEGPDGEAKFWLDPVISLAEHTGLSRRQLIEIQTALVENAYEIAKAWKKHFRR